VSVRARAEQGSEELSSLGGTGEKSPGGVCCKGGPCPPNQGGEPTRTCWRSTERSGGRCPGSDRLRFDKVLCLVPSTRGSPARLPGMPPATSQAGRSDDEASAVSWPPRPTPGDNRARWVPCQGLRWARLPSLPAVIWGKLISLGFTWSNIRHVQRRGLFSY